MPDKAERCEWPWCWIDRPDAWLRDFAMHQANSDREVLWEDGRLLQQTVLEWSADEDVPVDTGGRETLVCLN